MDLNALIMVHVSIYIRQLVVSLSMRIRSLGHDSDAKVKRAAEDNINHSFKRVYFVLIRHINCFLKEEKKKGLSIASSSPIIIL